MGDEQRGNVIKRAISLPASYDFAASRALHLLEQRGYDEAMAYLEGLERKAEEQIERGEIVPDERA